MTLDPARYARLERVFHSARELAGASRSALVHAELGDDPELLGEAERMLRHDEAGDDFLERPAAIPAPERAAVREGPVLDVDGFRILDVIGRGSMGVVYLAEDERLGRRVALKVLRADAATDRDLARSRREARALARVDHPGIARLLDSGVQDTEFGPRPWLSMSVVHGRRLGEAAVDLDHRGLARLFAKLADALHAAHEAGVVHRDLKPANVLVDRRGNPVVLDFGVATLRGDGVAPAESLRTESGVLLGTLAYMAPEQTRGGDVDARADVYAMGVLLYELATGHPPVVVGGVDLAEALRRIREDDPPTLRGEAGLPVDLATVLAKALAKEPAHRYRTAAELADDLRRFADDRPIHAQPPSVARRAWKLVRRNRVIVAATTAVTLAIAAGLAVAVVAIDRARIAEALAAEEGAWVARNEDALLATQLRERVTNLWPATPERVGEIERWVRRGEGLRDRLPGHLEWAARPDAEQSQLIRDVLVAATGLFEPPPGEAGFPDLVDRLEFARTLHARSVEDHRDAWEAAIADVAASPLYGGLELVPQVGLVPLGPDPDSGLHEFAHLGPTGRLARRAAPDAPILPEPGVGLVLVLVPGAEVLLGNQSGDPAAPLHYAEAQDHAEVHRVRLDPFLVSKFETTQGQYERVLGGNPSHWMPGDRVQGYAFNTLHPVESVDWDTAMAFAARLDLVLPTEDQHEYASRGGTTTPWWSGRSMTTLRGREFAVRVLDAPRGEVPNDWRAPGLERFHMEVGRYLPNPFGLHDVAGNVSEWCRDVFWVEIELAPPRDGDGLRVRVAPTDEPDNPHRSMRGGRTGGPDRVHTPAHRHESVRIHADLSVGFRLARALDRVERGAR